MNKDLQSAFEVLRGKYGSHDAAARNLDIGRDHYRAMRNGRVPITKKNERYILSEAEKIDAQFISPVEQPVEARP